MMFTRLERATKQFPEMLDSGQADGVRMEQHLVTLLRTDHPKIKGAKEPRGNDKGSAGPCVT